MVGAITWSDFFGVTFTAPATPRTSVDDRQLKVASPPKQVSDSTEPEFKGQWAVLKYL